MMKIFKSKRYEKSKKRSIAALVFFFINVFVHAQTDKIRFKHLSVGDGLSQEVVNCIIQDRKGFMWFGTQDGLNRYDGYIFKIYKNDPNDKMAISDKYILCLYEDREGYLWIGTKNGGLNRFNRESDNFINYKNDPSAAAILSDNDVQTIGESPDGDLWIGTFGGGLLRLDKKKNEFKGLTIGSSLNNYYINTIFKDINGRIWIGTKNGLDCFDQTTGKFFHYNIEISNTKNSINNDITAICEESKGSIWIGTVGGKLYRLDGQGGRPLYEYNVVKKTDPAGYNPVRCLFKDIDGILWIGTQKRVIRFNSGNGEIIEYEKDNADSYSISNNEVLSIKRDNTGITWFGTYGGGLNIYDPGLHRFKLYNKERNKLSQNLVWAILEDSMKRLWIGTYGGGLNLFDRKTGSFVQYIINEDVRCIHEDIYTGILWIGTHKNGLLKFNPETKQIEKNYPYGEGKIDGLSDKGVMCILQTGPDEMWLGTFAGGLDKFNPMTEEFIAYRYSSKAPQSISNDYVRTIFKDKSGNLWVGTDGGGLNFLENHEKGTFKNYSHDKADTNSLSHNRVKTIYQDQSGRIWVGTEGGGLNLLVDRGRGHFKAFGLLKPEVPNDTVYGILEDDQGNMWISTTSGLFKFSFKTGKDNKAEINIKNYDFQDGLQSNEFNDRAFFKNEETGEMFFGGASGFNSFLPQDIKDDPKKPIVVLTDFLLFNKSVAIQSKEKTSPLEKSIDETKYLTLTYKQNVITFEFAVLSYANPLKNKYQYKMEGYDQDWIETNAKNRRATYTNLSAGEYIFKVKGSNKDGLWSDKEASIKLKILPLPWKTRLILFLYVITLISILTVFLFQRFQRIKIAKELQAKEELERKVKERTQFLEKIDTIVRSIHAEMGFTDLLHKILKETTSIKDVEHASVLIWNSESKLYQFEATVGLNIEQLKQICFTGEEADARYIDGSEKIDEDIFIIRDAGKRPESNKIPSDIKSKSMLVMRIHIENKTEAYFIFGNLEYENAFADQDIQFLQKLKDHIVEAFKKTQFIHLLQEKNKELKEISDQLIQAEKLSSLGTLLAGIAHELFNPAGTIMLNAEWFAKAWKDIAPLLDQYNIDKKLIIANLPYKESREEIEKLLFGLLESSRRIKNLLEELKNFSRKEDRETKENIDIHTIIHTAVDLTQNLIKKSTENFSLDFGENIPAFPGNFQRLTQVFINLICNASEALPDNTHGISIVTSYLDKTNEILVQVKDEGVGIEEKNLSKIMDPFFTTWQNSGGMGLGLSISQKIIHEHHGHILFSSTPGQGTTASIYLPVKPINEK